MRDKLTLDEINNSEFMDASNALSKRPVFTMISFLLSERMDALRAQVHTGFNLLETKRISPKEVASSHWRSQITKQWDKVTYVIILEETSTEPALMMDSTGLLFRPGHWFPTGISEEGDMTGCAKDLPYGKVIEGLKVHVRTILGKCTGEALRKEIKDEELINEMIILLHKASQP
jgi:hypothetical protein